MLISRLGAKIAAQQDDTLASAMCGATASVGDETDAEGGAGRAVAATYTEVSHRRHPAHCAANWRPAYGRQRTVDAVMGGQRLLPAPDPAAW